jgi:hypothetical protein
VFCIKPCKEAPPEYLLLGTSEKGEDTKWSGDAAGQMEVSQAAVNDATSGLMTYQLK